MKSVVHGHLLLSMIGKMGLFGGYVRFFWDRGGSGVRGQGQGCGNYPSHMWMSRHDAEKVDGDGIWGWHDFATMHGSNPELRQRSRSHGISLIYLGSGDAHISQSLHTGHESLG